MNNQLLLPLAILAFCIPLRAQNCDFGTNQYPVEIVTVNTNSDEKEIDPCNWAGEFNLTTGYLASNNYQFASSIAADYLTIRNASTNAVIIQGTGPLDFVYPGSGMIECHIATSAACGAQQACRSVTVTCTTCESEAPPACVTLNSPADAATNVSLDAIFSWSPSEGGGPPAAYDFYLGITANDQLVNIGSITATSTAILGLDYETTYSWQVIPTNGGGAPTGCEVRTFTTPACPITTSPHVESFDALDTIPEVWAEINGFWTANEVHGFNNNGIFANLYEAIPQAVVRTEPVGPILTGDFLRFKARSLNFNGYPAGGGPAAGFGTFSVFVSIDCGTSYALIQQFGDFLSGEDWKDIELDLSSYVGNNCMFIFQADWAAAVGADYFIDIDNFEIGPKPEKIECAINLSPANGSGSVPVECGNELVLKWEANPVGLTPTSYDVFFGSSATNLTLLGNVTNTNYRLSGLINGGEYYYKIVPKDDTQEADDCETLSFKINGSADSGSGGINEEYFFANNYNTTGPASDNYQFNDPISGGHTQIITQTEGTFDDGYTTISLPFTFRFYGVDYTEAHMGTNGYLSFGAGSTFFAGNTKLGSTDEPNNMIAAIMMDLDGNRPASGMYHAALNPSQYAFTWYQMSEYLDTNEFMTVQLVLNSSNNPAENSSFEIRYNEAQSSQTIPNFLFGAVIGCEGDVATAPDEFANYREDGIGGPIFCSPVVVAFGATPPGIELPLNLLNFEGRENGKYNDLKWSTTNELNTDYMEIERSFDGIKWRSIGVQKAKGFQSDKSNYSFRDQYPGQINYYRLKMMDQDGRFEYSQVISINRNQVDKLAVIYPNPFADRLNISVSIDTNQVLNAQIFDMSGKIVSSKVIQGNAGTNAFQMDSKALRSGVYVLRLQYDDQILNHKIVKN